MKLTRQSLFAAMILGLAMYISCKGTISGDLPPYDPPPPASPPGVTEVDTTSIKAEDITVVEGDVTNEEAANFSNETTLANTPESIAAMNTVATEVASVVNATQTTYWSAETEASIETKVESSDAVMTTRTTEAKAILEANPSLAKYVPKVTNPSGRVLNMNARIGGVENLDDEDLGIFRITADDACLKFYSDYQIEETATLQAARDAQYAAIEAAKVRELAKLDKSKLDQETKFNSSYAVRKALFKTYLNTAITNIEAAVTRGDLTREVADWGLLLNNIVYAINLRLAYLNLQAELTLVGTKYTTGVTNLNSTVNTLRAAVKAEYDAGIKIIKDTVAEGTKDCGHDQGGHDQGGNG